MQPKRTGILASTPVTVSPALLCRTGIASTNSCEALEWALMQQELITCFETTEKRVQMFVHEALQYST